MNNADMPAMPTPTVDNTGKPIYQKLRSSGLTKREDFVKFAMNGVLATGWHSPPSSEQVVKLSLEYTDAMLAALEDKQ